MPESSPKGRTSARDAGRSDAVGFPLRLTYYKRMKRQRVYPFVVTWKTSKHEEAPPAAAARQITLRLLLAGAQVVPAELPLDADDPGDRATFFVTPLAHGWLRNQRLEVLLQGRKVQEIPLASKVVRHRLTWLLLILAFVVPWLMLTYVKRPYQEEWEKGGVKVKMLPSTSLENLIRSNVPGIPEALTDNAPAAARYLKKLPAEIGDTYEGLSKISNREPLAFYAGGILLLLALVSAFLFRDVRRRYVSKPIPLPRDNLAARPETRRQQLQEVEA